MEIHVRRNVSVFNFISQHSNDGSTKVSNPWDNSTDSEYRQSFIARGGETGVCAPPLLSNCAQGPHSSSSDYLLTSFPKKKKIDRYRLALLHVRLDTKVSTGCNRYPDILVIRISISESSIRICFPRVADISLYMHRTHSTMCNKRSSPTPENADVLIFCSKIC